MINFTSDDDPISEQSLQVSLVAFPISELSWVSSYEDLGDADLALVTQTGVTTNTTPVIVVDPPSTNIDRQLKSFHIKNQNVAAATVIVEYNDNASIREMLRVSIGQEESLIYEQSSGWRVLTSTGAVKIAFAFTDTTVLAQVNPLAATLTDALIVPSGYFIDDGHVVVVNRGVATSFRISLAPNGVADGLAQYFGGYDLPIRDNDVYDSALFNADALDVVRVFATDATLTFSIFAKKKIA